MKNARELNLEEMGKITGGELDSVITDYLDEAIQRAKVINKTVDQCIQDFYRYNKREPQPPVHDRGQPRHVQRAPADPPQAHHRRCRP